MECNKVTRPQLLYCSFTVFIFLQIFFNRVKIVKEDQALHKISQDLPYPPKPDSNVCKLLNESERFDCFPEDGANPEACELRGCCWLPAKSQSKNEVPLNIPYCFYPPNYNTYSFINISEAAFGVEAILERKFRSSYPDDVKTLKMTFIYESKDRLRVKVGF